MKLKKTALIFLILALAVPITNIPEKTNAGNAFSITISSCSQASLIEWTKVPGANKYNIYRKTKKNKKWAKKFTKIGTIADSYFTKVGGDNILNKRWYINISHNKKKNKKFSYKKAYKYKIEALNTKNQRVAVSNTVVLRKIKKIKNKETNYEMLYYVNKEREKHKKRVIPWGHALETGTLKRLNDCIYRHNNGDDWDAKTKSGVWLYHTRPKARLNNAEKSYGNNSEWIYLRLIDKKTLIFTDMSKGCENLLKGKGCRKSAKKNVKAYMNSKGHKEALLYSGCNETEYCSYNNNYFEVTTLNESALCVSKNYGALGSEKSRKEADKQLKIPIKFKSPLKISLSNVSREDISFHTRAKAQFINKYPFCKEEILNKYINNVNDLLFESINNYFYVPDENLNKYNALYKKFLLDYLNSCLPFQ